VVGHVDDGGEVSAGHDAADRAGDVMTDRCHRLIVPLSAAATDNLSHPDRAAAANSAPTMLLVALAGMLRLVSFGDYWRRALAQAGAMVVKGFGHPYHIFTACLVAAVVLVYVRRSASDSAVFSKFDDYVLTLQAALTVAALLFLVALVITPWRMHRAQEATTDAVRAERDVLAERQVPKLAFAFDPECCCRWAATSSGLQEHLARIGVQNLSDVPVTVARAYLDDLDTRHLRLQLRWSGRAEGPADLNPSRSHHHVSFLVGDSPNRHELDALDPATGFDVVLALGPHLAHVSVESANAAPVTAVVSFVVRAGEQQIANLTVAPNPPA